VMTTVNRTTNVARRRITRPTCAEDADRLVPALARWYLEYLAGQRPLTQVDGLLTPAVSERLRARRVALCAARGGIPDPTVAGAHVVSTQLRWTSGSRCEALALVQRGRRTTALAITLQRLPDRWRVTDLAGPEDGVPALHATPVPSPVA